MYGLAETVAPPALLLVLAREAVDADAEGKRARAEHVDDAEVSEARPEAEIL